MEKTISSKIDEAVKRLERAKLEEIAAKEIKSELEEVQEDILQINSYTIISKMKKQNPKMNSNPEAMLKSYKGSFNRDKKRFEAMGIWMTEFDDAYKLAIKGEYTQK